MARPQPRPSRLARSFDDKATWLKVVLGVTAVATCLTAVAAAIGAVAGLFDGSGPDVAMTTTTSTVVGAPGDVAPGDVAYIGGDPVVVADRTSRTDAFVRMLLVAEQARRPVLLNHHLLGDAGPADVTLHYACGTGTCSTVRVQVGDLEGLERLPTRGVWLQGCYAVRHERGNGYGSPTMDIPLTHQGSTCPST